jgi:hypothetical protein
MNTDGSSYKQAARDISDDAASGLEAELYIATSSSPSNITEIASLHPQGGWRERLKLAHAI